MYQMNQTPFTPPTTPTPGKNRPWIIIAAVVGLIVLLGYIGSSMMKMAGKKVGESVMERMIENAGGDKADVNIGGDGKMEIKTEDGTFSTGTDVPKDWPKDAPVYPGATVQYSASVNPSDGKPGQALVLMTADGPQKVVDYYTTELKDLDWTLSTTAQGGGSAMMGATKDGRVLSLMIAGTEGQTTITMGVADEE